MLSDKDIIYRIALGMMKGTSAELVRRLNERVLSVEDFFKMNLLAVSDALGLNSKTGFGANDREEALYRAEIEYTSFVERHSVKVLSLLDEDYPWLLSEIPDAPVTLYMLGDADLNSPHSMSVVGTRKPTQYGMSFCKQLCSDIGGYFPDVNIVSGLALGIDGCAHMAALECGVPTIAVVAHGLDTIYPAANRDLARRIVKSGGAIISEYPSGSIPYAGRFLERNRIVAGLSQLTVVVESAIKGGAMSTANLAFNYNREVMALPGRVFDTVSAGCNLLIRKEKAHLLTAAADIVEIMDWKPLGKHIEPKQRNLFPELEGTAASIYELLKFEADPLTVDAMHMRIGVSVPDLMSALTDLEFDGIIVRHAGNRYSIS